MSIGAVGSFPQLPLELLRTESASGTESAGKSFAKTVSNFIGQVNEQQQVANEQIQQLADGQTDNIHDVVLAVTQADLSFQMLLEIRNRLIDTYQELMRMQI